MSQAETGTFHWNGDIQALLDSGADPYGEEVKAEILFWGPDAGTYTPSPNPPTKPQETPAVTNGEINPSPPQK